MGADGVKLLGRRQQMSKLQRDCSTLLTRLSGDFLKEHSGVTTKTFLAHLGALLVANSLLLSAAGRASCPAALSSSMWSWLTSQVGAYSKCDCIDIDLPV